MDLSDNIFEEAFELSQRIEANQSAIRRTTYSIPKESEKNQEILATLQELLKGQATILEGQKDLGQRIKKVEENQRNILENQTYLSNGQNALVSNQENIVRHLECCETNHFSKIEFLAQNKILMECKVSIRKVEQSVCRMTGETINHTLNEVASMLPLKAVEEVDNIEEKV